MAWKSLGESEITIDKDGSYQTTETVNDGDTIDVINYITDHGSATITGPNDNLNGSGYYSDIENKITDQGSISNLSMGENAAAGYYSSGTVPDSSPSPTVVTTDTDSLNEYGPSSYTYKKDFNLNGPGIIAVSGSGDSTSEGDININIIGADSTQGNNSDNVSGTSGVYFIGSSGSHTVEVEYTDNYNDIKAANTNVIVIEY